MASVAGGYKEQWARDRKEIEHISSLAQGMSYWALHYPSPKKREAGLAVGYDILSRENPVYSTVTKLLPKVVKAVSKPIIQEDASYKVEGSVGKGNWATIPWVVIRNEKVSTSIQDGVYIAYLLGNGTNCLYLALMQGCGGHDTRVPLDELDAKSKSILSDLIGSTSVNLKCFSADTEAIELNGRSTGATAAYPSATILFKEYTLPFPDDGSMERDLQQLLNIYKTYCEVQGSAMNSDRIEPHKFLPPKKDKREPKTQAVRDILAQSMEYVRGRGFFYPDGFIENLYLSLKSKPFVILAGSSGTGKTRLARLFAEALGASNENGRFMMVPVRPDWSDSSDLFGYTNLNGKFVPGVILDFIRRATDNQTKPYFLCLDEMNLARVEYYLSDFLSVIETREFRGAQILTDQLVPDSCFGDDQDARHLYGKMSFPENLYLIGTVNMDETTFPFSKRVLDRANTLEFGEVDLRSPLGRVNHSVPSVDVDNDFLKARYVLLADCEGSDNWAISKWCDQLSKLNELLLPLSASIGYRIRDEVVFYLLNNQKDELLSEEDALDRQLLQKVLPRIQGSSAAVSIVLSGLFRFCTGADVPPDLNEKDVRNIIQGDKCPYPLSAKKIVYMMRRFDEEGYTSYWV